jgi:hypothetical protein
MKKALLLCLLLPALAFGASSDSLVWTGASDNDMNNVANYTEGDAGSPPAEIAVTDTLFFTSGTIAVTMSENLTIGGLSVDASVSLSVSGAKTLRTGLLVLAANATLTENSPLIITIPQSGDIITLGVGAVLNGTGVITCNISNGIASTFPAITYTGSGLFSVTDGGSGTGQSITLNGAFNTGTVRTIFYNQGTGTITYDFNGQNLTAGRFDVGCSGAGTGTWNYGSGTHTVESYTSNYHNAGSTININFQTSQWYCSGSWTFYVEHLVNPGTSLITLNGSGAQTVTSNGKSFYDLTVNNSGSSIATPVSFADSAALTGDLTLTDGPFVANGIGIKAVDYTYTTADSVRAGRLWLSGNYTRAAGASKCDTSGQQINFLAGASHTMAAAGKMYAKVAANAPLSITGGATIALLTCGADGIPISIASGTTLTAGSIAGIGGTPEHPDTLHGPGTLTAPQDTLPYTYVDSLICTNALYLDSTANTGGGNTNVKSLSYTGATLSASSIAPGDTVGIKSGNGFIGGGAFIGDSAIALHIVNPDSAWLIAPAAMPVGTYDVRLYNSDLDTLTKTLALTVASATTKKPRPYGYGYKKYRY